MKSLTLAALALASAVGIGSPLAVAQHPNNPDHCKDLVPAPRIYYHPKHCPQAPLPGSAVPSQSTPVPDASQSAPTPYSSPSAPDFSQSSPSTGSSQPAMAPPAQSAAPQAQPQAGGGQGFDYFGTASKNNAYPTNSISPAGAGLGTATGMGTGSGMDPIASTIFASVSPGLLTSANVQSPYALDRVTFSYSFYDRFQVTNTLTAVPTPDNMALIADTRRFDGFDLHRYDLVVEKAFGDMASVYVRVPYLDSTENVFNLPIDGWGNINAGLKLELLRDDETNNVLSTGITIAAPTSEDAIIVTNQRFVGGVPVDDPINTQVRLNPTYVQPWVGGQVNMENLFVQGYLGVLIPDDDQVVTSLNTNLTVGYFLYQDECGTSSISSIAPTIGVQTLSSLNSDDDKLIDYSDQVFLTPGLLMGLGDNTSLSAGVTTPVAGPRAFEVGANVGISFLY